MGDWALATMLQWCSTTRQNVSFITVHTIRGRQCYLQTESDVLQYDCSMLDK